MSDLLMHIWFFIIFIPSIYLFYLIMQCFNFNNAIFKGKESQFKIFYFLLCIILAFLFASAFVGVIEHLYGIVEHLAGIIG